MGAVHSPVQVAFSLWSPEKTDVAAVVDGVRHAMTRRSDADGYTNVYSANVAGDLHLKASHFTVNGQKVRDRYGTMVRGGPSGACRPRGCGEP